MIADGKTVCGLLELHWGDHKRNKLLHHLSCYHDEIQRKRETVKIQINDRGDNR